MLVTKCSGLNTNIILPTTKKRLPFNGNENNNVSQQFQEEKSDKSMAIFAFAFLALAGAAIFKFRNPICKFLGLGGTTAKDIQKALTDCTRFESSFTKYIDKKGKYNLKDAILQVEKTMLSTKEAKNGKGIIALLSDDVKKQCKIPESKIGIALGYIADGGNQPKFTKIISCKELLGIESFKAMGNNGVIILP